jgi:hypothetical protein
LPNNNEKPKREMTRRQLSHHQKESRIQRFAMLGGIIVIVAVLVIVGTGLYMNQFKPLNAEAIKVGNTEYNMDYYINMLAYYGKQQGADYLPYMTDYVAQIIEQNKVIQDAAAKLTPSVTVSDDEIDQYIQQQKLTSTQTTQDVVRAQLLINKLKDYFNDPAHTNGIPASGEQKAVLAMFLESQKQADEVIAKLNAGEKFQDIAAQLSLESSSKEKNGDFGWVPKGVLSTTLGSAVLEDKAFSPDTTLSVPVTFTDADQTKSVGYWLLKVTETKDVSGATQKHVFAMLLGSQDEANAIKAQLDAGADFVTLAKANSKDANATTDGGDKGFIPKGQMDSTVDAILFPDDASKALAVNTLSSPVVDTTQTTKGGVRLMEVTGTDANKTIDGTNRTTLVANAVNNWANTEWTIAKDTVQNVMTQEQLQYAITKAQSRLQ